MEIISYLIRQPYDALLLYFNTFINYFANSCGVDFSIFYSASYLALHGQPEMVYNVAVHHQVLENVLNKSMPYLLAWFYPPFYLLLVYPFALLPYNYSLCIWMGLTFAAYILTIYKIAPHKISTLLAIIFPGVLMNLLWSQNGFFNVFILGFGLYFIETNSVLSGLMFGLLCYKPQYAILPFLVLIVGRHWKTLFWSLFFAGTMTALSIAAFGINIWQKYIENIPAIGNLIANDWPNISAIQVSTYSFVRSLTGNQYWSTISQTVISITAIVVVCWIWVRVRNHYLRCTVLSAGVLLCTPYILQYDLALLAVPLAFYGYDIYNQGWLKGEKLVFIFLYLLPLFNWPLVEVSGFQITPIALMILIIMTLRRISRFGNFKDRIDIKEVLKYQFEGTSFNSGR